MGRGGVGRGVVPWDRSGGDSYRGACRASNRTPDDQEPDDGGRRSGAFVSIFFYQLPFPMIVLLAGVIGAIGARFVPQTFVTMDRHTKEPGQSAPVSLRRTVRVLILGVALWLLPVAIIAVSTGTDSVWTAIGVFFSQAAVVTFGGAYAVLAYMAQEAVDVYGWLQPGEMVDGLALAETTPGPLIQVTQFVGFLGGHRNSGTLPPLVGGVLGAVLTTWVTFVPSFLWILAGAPHVERLKNRTDSHGRAVHHHRCRGRCGSQPGCVVRLYTLFSVVEVREVIGARVLVPDLSSADLFGVAIALASGWAIFRWKAKILHVVGGAAVVGLISGLV